jgi:hypothetical protein
MAHRFRRVYSNQHFIELKSSLLDLVFFASSNMNSIALRSSIGSSNWPGIQIFEGRSGSISKSSRCVSERLM